MTVTTATPRGPRRAPGGTGLWARMKVPALRARVEGGVGRLLDALCDPAHRGRTVAAVLAAYCAVWTLFAVVARSSQDFHFDMGEMVAWSREVTLGTPKHPPLPAWLVGAWFAVFPLASWAYDLFAMVNAAAALWIAFMASTRLLDGVKSSVALAFLTLVPFFNFHALKFNANAAMLPWWALTTWLFLLSFDTPLATAPPEAGMGGGKAPAGGAVNRAALNRAGFAALAGVAAAGAMLVKYWSVVLIAAIVIAALSDRRRKAYFASPAPYLSVAFGIAALLPHLAWLWGHDFASFGYALGSHPATRLGASVSGLGYIAGVLGYAAVPIALTAAAARLSRPALLDVLAPREAGRRLAVLIFFLPLILPALLAAGASENVVSLWAIGGMTLLPTVLLSSPMIVISRRAATGILAAALAFPVAAVLAAPAVAVVTHLRGVSNYGDQYSLIADAAARFWHDTTGRPLRLVGSYDNVMNGSVFYFQERPSTLDLLTPQTTPWADDARIARDGVLLYCPVVETACMEAMNRRAAAAPAFRGTQVDISRRFLGIAGVVTRYAIVAVPPR